MSERQRQTSFLKALMGAVDTAERRYFAERIKKAEHDEKCLQCAVILVGLMVLFSLSGLGYSAVLLPEFFEGETPALVRILCAVGLASLICLVAFGAVWIWYRGVSNRLYEECRRLVIGEHVAPSQAADALRSAPSNREERLEVYGNETPAHGHDTAILSFPKAS